MVHIRRLRKLIRIPRSKKLIRHSSVQQLPGEVIVNCSPKKVLLEVGGDSLDLCE